MHQRHRICALAVVPFLAMGLYARTADDAPQSEAQAVKVAAHGSRWDYPRTLTPGPGQEVHIVVKGDTLWDLGTKYLANPFAWPQIWELNKWVKDPHWIYPGDPILVEASRSTVGQSKDQNLAPQDVAELQPDLHLVPKPVLAEYAFAFADFITMPYLVPSSAEAYFKKAGAFKIVGQQDTTRNLMASGDVLYLDGGSDQGLKPGDRLVITSVAESKFYNPTDTHRRTKLGAILQQEGIVRVTEIYPGNAVAVIEKCLAGITQGSYALPYTEPPAIPLRLRTDTGNPVQLKDPTPRVMFIPDTKAAAAAGDMVIIDRGTSDGFNVGDILLSGRSMLLDPGNKKAKATTTFYLGQFMVVRTEEHSATCRILRSNSETLVGDTLTR